MEKITFEYITSLHNQMIDLGKEFDNNNEKLKIELGNALQEYINNNSNNKTKYIKFYDDYIKVREIKADNVSLEISGLFVRPTFNSILTVDNHEIELFEIGYIEIITEKEFINIYNEVFSKINNELLCK
jgi:predicted nucleic acid-binding protein